MSHSLRSPNEGSGGGSGGCGGGGGGGGGDGGGGGGDGGGARAMVASGPPAAGRTVGALLLRTVHKFAGESATMVAADVAAPKRKRPSGPDAGGDSGGGELQTCAALCGPAKSSRRAGDAARPSPSSCTSSPSRSYTHTNKRRCGAAQPARARRPLWRRSAG